MTQYNNISVFKAKASDNPKSPAFNVVIEMADGSKFRGGLWEAVSKAGTKYLRGSLDVDTGDFKKPTQPKQQQSNEADIDW
jgi:uncharacterized protein (DUF736 family)